MLILTFDPVLLLVRQYFYMKRLCTYQCNPQHQVLVNKTIEILIQEEESWSQEG